MTFATRVCYAAVVKLKSNFNFSLFVVGLWGLAWAPLAAGQTPGADGGAAQRLVLLIDYVGGDYRLAVKDGAVLAVDEYAEQVRFAAEIRERGARLLPGADPSDGLTAKLAEIETLVRAKADPDAVARACHDAHEMAVARFGLETRPLQRPSLARADLLYQESCAVCHGARGDGDTEKARTLDPRPASFRDPDRLRDLSPYRVYNALTFGVPGTAMASFDSLTPQERWDLAFYVFRLGHDGAPAEGPFGVVLADLATRSDRELLAGYGGGTPAERRLAWARQQGPYVEPPAEASVARTREMLREATALFEQGRFDAADGRVLDAYLQGFEQAEPRLRARDAAGTRAVEAAFAELRAELSRGAAGEVRDRVRRLDETLARLENRRPLLPFAAAALIYLREGLEAALLVGALLAGATRLGLPGAARAIHTGWLLALPAGVLTWWAFTGLLALGAHQRELVEAVVALLAAAVLFSVSFWMISKAESQRWTAYLNERLQLGVGRGNLALLTGLAFLAVYREAAETVLFTQALLLEAAGHAAQVWSGAAAGAIAVAAVALAINRAVVRLPLAPFFAVSSVLLLVLAVSFAGSGINDLVAAGYLRPRPVRFPAVPWLGIHPELTGLVVQLVIVSVVAFAGIVTLRQKAPLAARDANRPEPR